VVLGIEPGASLVVVTEVCVCAIHFISSKQKDSLGFECFQDLHIHESDLV
jgi:hypothetical protein